MAHNDPQIVDPEFLERPTLEVARDLLDCTLCQREGDTVRRWRIMETEAYDGPDDQASHARSGRTARTEVMFGKAGLWYVYLCYGIHWMLNIVTGPAAYPAAVLIRGAGEIQGPGRLTRALGITGMLNNSPAVPDSGLWIEYCRHEPKAAVICTPRIGVAYAGPDWSQRPYRFVVKA